MVLEVISVLAIVLLVQCGNRQKVSRKKTSERRVHVGKRLVKPEKKKVESVRSNTSDSSRSRVNSPEPLTSPGNSPGTPTPTESVSIDEKYEPKFNDTKNSYTTAQWREYGQKTVEYIAKYKETLYQRRVVPAVLPGFLKDQIPAEAPRKPESYDLVMADFEKKIMPGMVHWHHPRFHAYFPSGGSYPSLVATMLCDMTAAVGFSWASCPSMTELETQMLSWLGKMIGLPADFLPFTPGGKGGAVMQTSASECILDALLAARFNAIKTIRQKQPHLDEGEVLAKLIAYTSKEAHSSVEKACLIGMVNVRLLDTDDKFRLRGETVKKAIEEDVKAGRIPFFVSTTLGTTSCVSFDVLSEIGPICEENKIWLHVDAAYAGSAMICPEFRHLMKGIEYAMSFNMNPNKWMLVHMDSACMWVRDRVKLTQALIVDPVYLQHSNQTKAIDYRHWQIPLSRRFRSLKLWFVIRMYGVEGLRRYIREHVRLAKKMETMLRMDGRFEIVADVIMGLVCFRLKGAEDITKTLLTRLNASGRIHMVPAQLNGHFVIRFCVVAENTTDEDIESSFQIIATYATHVIGKIKQSPLLPLAAPKMKSDSVEMDFESNAKPEKFKFGFTPDQWRKMGKEAVEYVARYKETLHKRRCIPAIQPGYLKDELPEEAPMEPEPLEAIMEDFERKIQPGVAHWMHPRFHAYFPSGASWPSMVGTMLCDMTSAVGFSWAACPSMTELEMHMMSWLGKLINLPEEFLPFTPGGNGGGVILSSASECILNSLLAARFDAIKKIRTARPDLDDGFILSRLIAYCSKESHSCVEKACLIAMVKVRILNVDDHFRLRGDTVKSAIEEDTKAGLIPFFLSSTLGTTGPVSFDVLSEIGPVCKQNDIWFHCDCAYAGSAMICPEFRHLMKGIEYTSSVNVNASKWMLSHCDTCCLWVRDRVKLTQALMVDPVYLQHSNQTKAIDYRHWQIPLSRRFRSLKLWFVLRMYGVEGIQSYIREHVRLAKRMESLIRADDRFEVVNDVLMGLVCFKFKDNNDLTKTLLTRLNASGKIHMIPTQLNDQFVIRFCVCAESTTEEDIDSSYHIISKYADRVLNKNKSEKRSETSKIVSNRTISVMEIQPAARFAA